MEKHTSMKISKEKHNTRKEKNNRHKGRDLILFSSFFLYQISYFRFFYSELYKLLIQEGDWKITQENVAWIKRKL